MKVSIVTVTYNSELFLESCIQSVESQTYKDIEHIVIDGNSKDNTLSIIKKFKNIKYLSEVDNGIYDAINKGIRLASGDILGILNSDDLFADNEVLQRIVTEFEQENLSVVFSDVQFVQRNDTSKPVRFYSSKFFKLWMFKFGFQPAHPTFYAKRELFDKFGVYRTDLRIAGDFELLLRFLKKNKVQFKYVRDVWVKMRVGGISTSGLSSILELNNEIVMAHRQNGIYTNMLFVYSKYLIKWWGFIKR